MTKQVIVMRKDLGMTKGKMISQGAHASMGVLLKEMRGYDYQNYEAPATPYDLTLRVEEGSVWQEWLEGIFTKITLKCESEAELLSLLKTAEDSGLPCTLITDVGLTQFKGLATNTCIAIGPALAEDIDKITGHLKLY